MPRKVTQDTSFSQKWNLYVNEIEKLNFIKALINAGKTRAQSAAIRAMMHLYVTDTDVQNKVNAIVDNFIIYNNNGDKSLL